MLKLDYLDIFKHREHRHYIIIALTKTFAYLSTKLRSTSDWKIEILRAASSILSPLRAFSYTFYPPTYDKMQNLATMFANDVCASYYNPTNRKL